MFHTKRAWHIYRLTVVIVFWSAGFALWCKRIFFDLFWSVNLFLLRLNKVSNFLQSAFWIWINKRFSLVRECNVFLQCSPERSIFPLIFIATIRQIFCVSPLLLLRIRCQFFPSWIPFEHSNFSLRLQPHSPIKPDWSDLRDLNFDCIQFSGFRTQWCNARSSLRCLCTIDWQFSRPARLIFPSGASRPIGNIRTHRMRVETIFGDLPCRRSLTPCVSPSSAPVLSFAHYFQVPAMQAIWLPVMHSMP